MIEESKAYFVNDLCIAEYCCSEIKKVTGKIFIKTYNTFEEYFNKKILFYSQVPFVDVAFQYYKLHNFMKQIVDQNRPIDIIVNPHIAGVKITINPSHLLSVSDDLNNPEVVRYYLRGMDLKLSAKNVYEKLHGQALLLYKLRSIYINKRHLDLKEFLDQITEKLLLQFNGLFAKFYLWEKEGGKELYKNIPDNVIFQQSMSEHEALRDKKIKALDIDEIADAQVKCKLKSLKIKYYLIWVQLFLSPTLFD